MKTSSAPAVDDSKRYWPKNIIKTHNLDFMPYPDPPEYWRGGVME
jgi:hypothetical protein